MTDRELMQQALEALENFYDYGYDREDGFATLTALRERLAQPEQSRGERMRNAGYARRPTLREFPHEDAQPEQEPVAWLHWVYGPVQLFMNKDEAMLELERLNREYPSPYRKLLPLYTTPQPNTIANSEAIPKQISEQEPVAWWHEMGGVVDLNVSGHGRPLYFAPPRREWPTKLWLWRNHVDGKPEYWAFDNPYPKNLDNGDPQTLGQPCGYAIFKESRDGSNGRAEEQVLREMKSVSRREQPEHAQKPVAVVESDGRLVWLDRESAYGRNLYTTPPRREWVGLDRKEMLSIIDQQQAYKETGLPMFYRDQCLDMLRTIEAKLKEKNS